MTRGPPVPGLRGSEESLCIQIVYCSNVLNCVATLCYSLSRPRLMYIGVN